MLENIIRPDPTMRADAIILGHHQFLARGDGDAIARVGERLRQQGAAGAVSQAGVAWRRPGRFP